MRYTVNLHTDDFEHMHQEGSIIYNLSDQFNGIQHLNKANKLGAFEVKRENHCGFILMESHSLFTQDVKLSETSPASFLALHFMLSGNVQYHLPNIDQHVTQGENSIWSMVGADGGHAQFKKNTSCKSWGCIFKDEYLLELTNKYPDLLTDTFYKYSKGEAFCYKDSYQRNTIEMNHILKQISMAGHMGNMKELYLEAKILELLVLQIQNHQTSINDNKPLKIKNPDIEKIREAKSILLSNINTPLCLGELSKAVGINEKKLKHGFKELYQNTVFGYLFEYKMNRAQQMLLDTDKNIFEIGLECGYEYPSHFTTAFKRRFGLTPMQFRKSKKSKLVTIM